VSLTATNAGGSNTLTRTGYITVSTPAVAPVASFTGTPTSGSAPRTVAFTDASTNSPTSWAWTFGDGYTSTLKSPSHAYSTAGTYTVSLTATNAGGSNTLTRTGYITVSTATVAPVASFTGTPTTGKFPLTVSFTDASTNSPTSWYWTFGDGSTSTLKSPSHTYSAKGTYTVSLKATNAGGSNTLTRTGYIIVQASKVTNK
jgi:PKD repeat protein